MSNAEIAAALYITPGTAKTHVARLLATLGARDRIQLVITAYQAGLFDTSGGPSREHRRSMRLAIFHRAGPGTGNVRVAGAF